jgi:DNA-binding protein YbaB
VNEFGDFGNIDVDKLLSGSQERMARIQELQQRIAELTGRAEDPDGLVKAVFTAGEGLADLTFEPRAMRKGSQELAALVKEVVKAASADLQRQIGQATREALGAETMDPQEAMDKAAEAQAAFNRTLNDAVGELERIRRRAGL